MYFAHSSNDASKGDWQPLAQHLSEVAELAALFAGPCGCERAARIAGLLHDLGKYHRDFQRRLWEENRFTAEGHMLHVAADKPAAARAFAACGA